MYINELNFIFSNFKLCCGCVIFARANTDVGFCPLRGC